MRQSGTLLGEAWDLREHDAVTSGGSAPSALQSEPATAEEFDLILRLRRGDEAAFTALVDRYHQSLVRLALAHVSDRSVAEEVVQESWVGVLEGLDRFEGRSSLKTWIFRIVTNKAKTRGVRENRHTSFSDFGGPDEDCDEPAVDPSNFRTSGHWADYWASYPQPWDENTPERQSLSKEVADLLGQAISALPVKFRQVLLLRDVEGLGSKDVCDMLGLSEANQRVLLHRGRARVRRALDHYMTGGHSQA